MSLATTGGGGAGLGGGGMGMAAMAHGGPNAGSLATHQPSHQHSGIPGGGGAGTAAPGTSYAALGADLLDKNQSFLNGKNVRNVATLPLVAVDLYGDKCDVAYFPPMEEKDDDAGNDDEMVAMMKAMDKLKKGVQAKSIGGYCDGDNGGTNVTLKKDDGDAYKAVKRYLNKGEGHEAVLADALVKNSTKNDDDDVIVIPRPHLVMGARKISDLNPAAKSTLASILPAHDATSNAIDDTTTSSPLSLTTIAMDGNSQPKGDDYDRVAFQMRLNSKKKLMTILPEEALALVIASCKKSVKESYLKAHPESELNDNEDGEEDESYFPAAFAIPGWATLDSTVEALIDAAGGRGSSCGPSLHQRSIAACVGALLPPPSSAASSPPNVNPQQQQPPPSSKLNKLLTETMTTKDAEASKEAAKQAALERRDPVEPEPFVPLVVLVGATLEGIEMTAVQITKPQGPDKELHCPFGNISVISSVCYATNDPLSIVKSTLDELRSQIGVIVPESEEPTVLVTYGSIGTQVKLATKLKSTLTKYGKSGQDDDDWDGWDQDIPIVSTKEECVSMGLAVLAASVHGRVRVVVSEKRSDGKMRPRAKLGVSVQDVATCAVAVSFNYFGGKDDEEQKWTEPKVIFDFDRRVPAGPYQIDFTAAECAAHVQHSKKTNEICIADESVLIDQAKSLEGSRGIPEREGAALQLRFRLYQRTSHDDGGEWIQVGDDMRPLSVQHSQKDEGESGEDHFVAIESAVFEISLNTVGLITTGLITNGETIVQATKSARNSKLLRWGGIIGSFLFIGGFLVKSFVEERVFERDTQRVLAYYKHAAPNSFHDGDERQARYLVWKYKGKKDKLWRRLESKYQVPVKHAWEWEDEDVVENGDAKGKEDDEEAEDLDGEEGSEKSEEGGEEL
ncbi:hypothetical protein ACHAXR_007628 [Thalassiosira sp. AJA248-18]